MAKDKNYFFGEEEDEKKDEAKAEEVIETVKPNAEKKLPPKQKTKYTVLFISKGVIYLSYMINEIKYGMNMPMEKKYENVKPGDVIQI